MFTLKYIKTREWDSEDPEFAGIWHRESKTVIKTATIHPDNEENEILESCINDDPENPVHIEIIRWPVYYDVLQFFYPLSYAEIQCHSCGSKVFEIIVNPQEKKGFLQCADCEILVPGISLNIR